MENRTYNKRNRQMYSKNAYISGSAAPAYEAAPVRKTVTEPLRTPERRVKPKEKAKVSVDFGMVMPIVFLSAVITIACIIYLGIKSSNNAKIDKIAALESQISQMAADNTVRELDIYSSVDYSEVYNRAVEMGMGHPTSEQIITYNRDTLEYVKQYENIPDND